MNQNSIISLDLSSNEGLNRNRISIEGIKLIQNVLINNNVLEFLNLAFNSIKTEGFKYLVNGLNQNSTLRSLNVSKNDIDEEGIIYLKSNLLSSKLENLVLSLNPIGDEGCISLGSCIGGEQLKDLIRLDISQCSFRFKGFKEFICQIKSNRKLNVLLVNGNYLYSKNWLELGDYINFLNIKHLGLNSCALNNSCSVIVQILRHHQYLKILELSHNQVDDDCFITFQDLLDDNIIITEIDLSRNYITDKSGKIFFKKLTENKGIQSLNFYDNDLSIVSANIIFDCLKFNNSLTYINLKYNRIPLKILKKINMRIQYNKILAKKRFVPQIKQELVNLAYDDGEICSLKSKIIFHSRESGHYMSKLKESKKIIKLKKEEHQKELKKSESQEKNLLDNIEEFQNKSKPMNDSVEKEINNLQKKISIIETNIIGINCDINKLKEIKAKEQANFDKINKSKKSEFDANNKKLETNKLYIFIAKDKIKKLQEKLQSISNYLLKLKSLKKKK
jgi:hypothetical protein